MSGTGWRNIIIDDGLAMLLESKGLLTKVTFKDSMHDDEIVGEGYAFTNLKEFNGLDLEEASRLWNERQAVKRRKRIEDLLSEDESGAAPKQMFPLSRVQRLRRDAFNEHDDWNDRYRNGYMDALDDLVDGVIRD